MQDTHISLAHGNGGRFMRELIDELFARHLSNPDLDTSADAVGLSLEGGELLFTTDGFTVQPLEFPGGDIGSLAVHGTTNDLAVAGGLPRYLSLNAFIEEGLEIELLDRLIGSLARAAAAIGVEVVAGDTKVLRRGEGGGLYLATTGIGVRLPGPALGIQRIRAGDRLVVSGPVGDHGIAVMLAREQFGLRGDVRSDAASVLPLTSTALDFEGLRFMRDPTRGGLATVCHELSRATGLGIRLAQQQVPVRDPVQSVCEMLGYDPLYLACEGRVVAVIDSADSDALLQAWKEIPAGEDAAV
ncbi:MAG TPA: hydrogenase expression/formation protein HypE, partial [Gammaproteobacteria bacterium]|nr:hydrogenase expression/formation protein HypE [Gammaproteobacteria bacterium]